MYVCLSPLTFIDIYDIHILAISELILCKRPLTGLQLMQLNTMNCSGRSNINEQNSELGDDATYDDHSDDGIRECDSNEGEHIMRVEPRLSTSMANNGGSGTCDISRHEHANDVSFRHRHQFPSNHQLNALGTFMGINNLHGISNLQHSDVLEKLKMQVRDIKVGLMDHEYVAAHAAAFGSNVVQANINTAFSLPPTTMSSFNHVSQAPESQASNNLCSHLNSTSSLTSVGPSLSTNSQFTSFTSPPAPCTKDVNPASNSSTSSETSNSSQQNGWSFEEQYKQVRQLYEINDDPKRKDFLDDLFSFMQKRGTPINRLPIMAKSVLDLYELYNLVIARGGLVDVINKKLWQEIIKGLHLPSSITSAAFTLRTQYMKYLYPYECEKKNLSTPAELQAAIDGNRREGRRSSYGQYEVMHTPMQMPQMSRQSLQSGLQQMSPLALVTHAANNQQAQAAAAAVAAHHRLMAPSFGQMPNVVTQEIEQRMLEYLKLIQVKKEHNNLNSSSGSISLSPQRQHLQQQRQRSQSPEISPRDALNALEMSRVALWQLYQNNTSPPASENISPQDGENINNGGCLEYMAETQREALNLSESPPTLSNIKREREPTTETNEHSEFLHQPPPPKRSSFNSSFFIPNNINNSAVAASSRSCDYNGDNQVSDNEAEDDNDEQNATANTLRDDFGERQHSNTSTQRQTRHHVSDSSIQNDKSDDSAIENSPTTSAASAGNEHNSPVSTKKNQLPKTCSQNTTALRNTNDVKRDENIKLRNSSSKSSFEAISLLSGMQFRVTQKGTNPRGEQELVVNLELNGVNYSGVLTANTSNIPSSSSLKSKESYLESFSDKMFNNPNAKVLKQNISNCTFDIGSYNPLPANTNNNINETIKNVPLSTEPTEEISELTISETESISNKAVATDQNRSVINSCSKNISKDV